MSEFSPNLTLSETQAMIGQYEMEKRIWQREYAKLTERLAQLEAELATYVSGMENDQKELVPQ